MNMYEKMIQDALANGSSADDIAKGFAEALDSIKSKKVEHDKAVKTMNQIQSLFDSNFKNNRLEPADVGRLAALMYAPMAKKPWSADDINMFVKHVNDNVAMSASIMSASDIEEIMAIGGRALQNLIVEFAGEDTESSTPSKPQTMSDDEAIKTFLELFK